MNKDNDTIVNWKRYALILVFAYLLVYILPLGVRPVIIPDEARYAEIPREMITTGNWVSPHLNGLRYFEKPVLGYWATAISMQLFGSNNFAMRLPSALAVGLTALGIFLLLRRVTRRPQTALNAAMIYLSMLGVFIIGTFNVLDTLFSFLLTAAFIAFYYYFYETDPKKRLLQLILLGVFCGAAFLTKGFLAFVLLAIVIAPFVIWQGRWQELYSRGWIALLAALVVIAPWSILVHLREPDYWHYFFWEEHVKRFAGEDAQHPEEAWFFLMVLPALILPWITQLPVALKGLFNKKLPEHDDTGNLYKFSLLWFLIPFIFFSASHGKLPTYILPCTPPIAIMLAIGFEKYMNTKKAVGFNVATVLMAVIYIVFAVILVLVQNGVIGEPVWYKNEAWKWVALVLALLAGAVLLLYSLRSQSMNKRLTVQAASIVAVMLLLTVALPRQTAESKMPAAFLQEHADKVTPDTILISDDIMIHAVNFYYKRADVYMTHSGESKHGLSFADSKHRLLSGDRFKRFLNEHQGKDRIVFTYHADADAYFTPLMPSNAVRSTWGYFVLWYIPLATES